MKDLTDEQLMVLLQHGEAESLGVIYSRYRKSVFNYFLKCTLNADDAGDLTQMLFVRVMRYKTSFKSDKRLKIWLFQIARNLVKDHFKKMKVYQAHFDFTDNLPEINDSEEARSKIEEEKKLYKAMGLLSNEKRELLVLSKFQGMKYEEIANMRNVSLSAVKVQVHRTIAELRKIYFEDLKHE